MKLKNDSLDALLLKDETYQVILEKMMAKNETWSAMNKAPVIKNLSLQWIKENQAVFLKKIKNALVDPDFEFSTMKKINLMTQEKSREIFISNYADRILMMALQNILATELNKYFPTHLYSFRKGLGPKQAAFDLSNYIKGASLKTGSLYFIGRDVSSYGDSINHKIMDETIDSFPTLKNSHLLKSLIKKSYRCEYFENDSPKIAMCLMKGIPSGAPLVPVLENIYLKRLDEELGNIKNAFYARYGDDFILLTDDEKTAKSAKVMIDEIVASLQLTMSEKKAKNYLMGTGKTCEGFVKRKYFEWIGITFSLDGTYSFKPKHRAQYKKKIRTEIGNFTFHLGNAGLTKDQFIDCVNVGFNELTSLRQTPEVQKLIVLRTNIPNTKTLDKQNREFLVRCISKTLKVSKREAWKIFRKINLHSLEYQRRKLKCNKKIA